MTPAELARRHPRLFHVTSAGAWSSIRRHGLLSTSRILDLLEMERMERRQLEAMRRPRHHYLDHPDFDTFVLGDNSPLHEATLAGCLDDGLSVQDWLLMLNARVFFWADMRGANRLLQARANRTRPLTLLVIDTFSLATAHAERIELSPINSGAASRRPARRGAATLTPLSTMTHEAWRQRCGRRDRILEVIVMGAVADIAQHILEVRRVPPASTARAGPASILESGPVSAIGQSNSKEPRS